MTDTVSSDESHRQKTLADYRILDTEREKVFDELVGLAAAVCQTPMAILSFIDARRQWFKASVGLNLTETPRETSFYDHMIRSREPMVVADASQDDRFAANPLVVGEPHIQFYAGMPLVTGDGSCIGSVAVMDTRARSLEPFQLAALRSLGHLAMHEIELRRGRLTLEASLNEQQKLVEVLRQRDQELAQTHELLSFHLENMPLAIVELDEATRVTRWSPQAELLFGWPRDEVLGKPLAGIGLVHPEDVAEVTASIEKLLSGETPRNTQVNRNIARSGEVLVCEWHNSARLDPRGRLVSILSFANDITGRLKAEEQLGQSQALLEMAGRAARLGGWQIDLKSNRVTWSDVVAAIHEEPPGASPSLEESIAYYAPEYQDRIREVLAACVTKGKPYDEELQIITAKGNRVWVRAIGEPIRDLDGKVTAVQGAFQDISDRKGAEMALRLSEERYRHAAEASQAALWDYDMTTDQVEFSESFRDMLGYERLEDMPTNLEDYMKLMHPEDRERTRRRAQQLVAGETGDRASAEFRLLTQSGKYRWFQSNSKVIRDADGQPIRRLGSTIDIHDRKVAEERNRELAERLSSTLESITDAFFTLDRDWRLTYLNLQAEILFRRKREEFLGRVLWDEFPEAVNLAFYTDLHAAVEKRQTVEFEEFYPPFDSWFAVTAYPTEEGLAVYFRDTTDKRKAEAQAEDSAERMHAVLETAADAIITIDESATIESVNPATERMFGYTSGELLGRNIRMLMPSSHQEKHDNYVRRYLETGEARIIGTSQRLSAQRRDGSEFPIELSVREIRLSGRRVFTGFIRDISGEEEARKALRTSEERFRSVARATTDVIWDLNLDTGKLWWSDGLESAFGYTFEEAGDHVDWWAERVHPEDREQTVASLEAAIENRQTEWIEQYRFRRKDGEYAHVVDSGYVIAGDSGNAARMVGGMQDITERRLARQRLAEQAELLDKARDAIIVRDLEHRITYWNKGAERIYGWSAEEAIGKSGAELLYEETTEYGKAFREVLEKERWEGQLVQKRKDGSPLTVHCHCTLVLGADGRPRSILSINSDITEKLELEEQLRQAQRLESIGQLTGGVAHDFNNLLTVMMGNSELLVERLESNPRLRHLAELSLAAAQRGAELTNRLLAFARRQTLDPHPTDVAELIDGMQPLLRQSISAKIDIRMRHAPDLWRAEIDPGQLESALLNLTLNARDAMPDGGRLTIETSNIELDRDYADTHADVEPGEYVQITVSDSGIGIEAANLNRLFEPFFTTKEKGKGTGLGLPMVYGFVKQSRGHIRVYSEPGEGTTVRIYLPRSLREDARAPSPIADEQALKGSERILVVEDDELVQEHAERLLTQLGYRVTTATDGREALALIRELPPFDLLFTDVIMPGDLSGPALARAVREIQPEIRILYTSGYTEDAIVHHGRLDEGVQLLQKPYRRIDLARKVRESLSDNY